MINEQQPKERKLLNLLREDKSILHPCKERNQFSTMNPVFKTRLFSNSVHQISSLKLSFAEFQSCVVSE